ncbi:MAG: glycosyltransferase family 2 protein [Flavobacterium sp.]
MIVVIHDQQKVTQLFIEEQEITTFNGEIVTTVIPELLVKYPNVLLVWCHQSAKDYVAWTSLPKLFDLDRKMLSYLPNINFFPEAIGYVEDSISIKVNKKVTFPTWQMSSYVGGISTTVLAQMDKNIWKTNQLDYALNSIAKTYQSEGLFCYSEPKLLLQANEIKYTNQFQTELDTLFHFVKEHFKGIWTFLLFFNLLVYERKIALKSLLKTFFIKKKTFSKTLVFNTIDSNTVDTSHATIDVIIPTIGRKKYLKDVLKDLSVQTHLPKNVIIVEQNPEEGSQSELDFLQNETWPFVIKHFFLHQAGACNARNLALAKVSSDWIFFADDDIRFESNLISSTLQMANHLNKKVLNLSCLQPNEKKSLFKIMQWPTFGSGCSFVNSKVVEGLKYSLSYEFGFGEDADFGMQIRNKGFDVIYLPEPAILHLKAPMGGFRTKPKLDWQPESVAPKPSPTVMLFALLHKTEQQLLGYKTTLFFKYYKLQPIKNPWLYYRMFQKQWEVSLKWANFLNDKHAI